MTMQKAELSWEEAETAALAYIAWEEAAKGAAAAGSSITGSPPLPPICRVQGEGEDWDTIEAAANEEARRPRREDCPDDDAYIVALAVWLKHRASNVINLRANPPPFPLTYNGPLIRRGCHEMSQQAWDEHDRARAAEQRRVPSDFTVKMLSLWGIVSLLILCNLLFLVLLLLCGKLGLEGEWKVGAAIILWWAVVFLMGTETRIGRGLKLIADAIVMPRGDPSKMR
jgi:hypothetical protein